MVASPSATAPTMEFPGYRVIASLGHGGMARVYLGLSEKQPGFTKLFVLKSLKDELAGDPELLAMFVQEAHVAARLNHPNVVQTYEVGSRGENPFIAMEYLDGQPLNVVVKRLGKALSVDLVMRVLVDVLAGLHYAHELADYDGTPMGIVHRDISPHNVFVTYDGAVKVLDFGIAKVASAPSMTRTGVMKGKVGYMAPEQVLNQGVDRRADLFAVGVIMWEAIAGKRLVDPGTHEVAALQARLSGAVPSLSGVSDASPELVAIAHRALALDPTARFATAEEMQLALEEYLRGASNPQARDLGKLLREHFAAERAKLRKLIEERIAQPSPSSPTLPVSHSSEVPTLQRHSGTPSASASAGVIPDAPIVAAKAPSRPGVIVGLAGVGLVVALVAGVLGLRSFRGRDTQGPTVSTVVLTTQNPEASGARAPSPPAAPPASVSIRLSVSPRGATVLLDGAPVSPDGFVQPRDERARHELKVTLAGHQSATREITLDRDQDLAVALAPAAPVAAAPRGGAPQLTAPSAATAAARPSATTAAPPPADSGFTEVRRTPRPIDTTNPF